MLFLAIRQLLSRKKQTLLILFGISLGSMAYVAISGLLLGFRGVMLDQLINNDAHVKISAREQPVDQKLVERALFDEKEGYVHWLKPPFGFRTEANIYNPQGWFTVLEDDPRVFSYVPQLTAQVIVEASGTTSNVNLLGVVPDRHTQVTNIQEYMTEGQFSDLSSGGGRMIVGDEFLKRLGLRMGDTMMVSAGIGNYRPFRIVGSFHTGIYHIDLYRAYGSLLDVQRLTKNTGHISHIAIRLVNADQAAEIATNWNLLSRDLVQSWDQINANFLEVFAIQDFVRLATAVTILIVAGFGIYNILTIMIAQKRREIAILRSIGYDSHEIILLFLAQGLILGFSGALLGIVLGYFICKLLELLPGTGMFESMVISFAPSIYVVGFSMAVFASIIASILPARAAGRLTPIGIIRSEGS